MFKLCFKSVFRARKISTFSLKFLYIVPNVSVESLRLKLDIKKSIL